MLEAVHSVLQTAPLVRAQTEQVSVAESYAANPERVQRALPQAPYVSPYIYIDVAHNRAILQLRNGETGDVEGQFPSEASLRVRAQEAASSAATPVPAPQQQSAPQTEAGGQAFVQNTAPAPDVSAASSAAVTAQQQAAFAAAARAGNSNAGSVTLFA